VWSWRPDAGAKFSREAIPAKVTGAKEPGPRREREISCKTIAQGRPDVSGVAVVANACAFLLHTRPWVHWAPGLPCAL
jgi:hypothetical protein